MVDIIFSIAQNLTRLQNGKFNMPAAGNSIPSWEPVSQATARAPFCVIVMFVVYFVRPIGEFSPIKIGRSSRHRLESRIASLQTACWLTLEVVGTIDAEDDSRAAAIESGLHQKFSEFRIRGEWFMPHPKVLAAIGSEPSVKQKLRSYNDVPSKIDGDYLRDNCMQSGMEIIRAKHPYGSLSRMSDHLLLALNSEGIYHPRSPWYDWKLDIGDQVTYDWDEAAEWVDSHNTDLKRKRVCRAFGLCQ